MNTCLYVLIQTFRIIKEPTFINALFSALFQSELPNRVVESIESSIGIDKPSFYK